MIILDLAAITLVYTGSLAIQRKEVSQELLDQLSVLYVVVTHVVLQD